MLHDHLCLGSNGPFVARPNIYVNMLAPFITISVFLQDSCSFVGVSIFFLPGADTLAQCLEQLQVVTLSRFIMRL